MEINVPSQFLRVVLTEEQERCALSAAATYATEEVEATEKSAMKVRSPPPLLPLPLSTTKFVSNKCPKKKEDRYTGNRKCLSDQDKWNLTKHLPKTLLAECTVEIHSTPKNRFEKVRQELCFDARVFPVFSKSSSKVLAERNDQAKSVTSETYDLKLDNQISDREDDNMNNVFELIEAVYSDHDSEDETKAKNPPVTQEPLYLNAEIAQDHSATASSKSTPKTNFKCEHCPNVYPNRGALWQHTVATHSVEKNCECKICGRKFYRNCSLALHLKSHSEDELCTCKECGKSFSRLINLERHMKIHTGAEQIQCEHCDKTFCDRNNLLRHIVCHLSPTVRTYNCDICSKSYKSEDHLEIHNQTSHAAISCSVCGKSFSTLSELSLHDATHAFEHRFVCKFCNKLFSQKAVLRKHLTIHIGEKLKCNTCGIEFTQRSSLLRHLKRMHCSSQVKSNTIQGLNAVSLTKTTDPDDCNFDMVTEDLSDRSMEDYEYAEADVHNVSSRTTDQCVEAHSDPNELLEIDEAC